MLNGNISKDINLIPYAILLERISLKINVLNIKMNRILHDNMTDFVDCVWDKNTSISLLISNKYATESLPRKLTLVYSSNGMGGTPDPDQRT